MNQKKPDQSITTPHITCSEHSPNMTETLTLILSILLCVLYSIIWTLLSYLKGQNSQGMFHTFKWLADCFWILFRAVNRCLHQKYKNLKSKCCHSPWMQYNQLNTHWTQVTVEYCIHNVSIKYQTNIAQLKINCISLIGWWGEVVQYTV